jgi:hypothetical protein
MTPRRPRARARFTAAAAACTAALALAALARPARAADAPAAGAPAPSPDAARRGAEAKARGDEAVDRLDYVTALEAYQEAIALLGETPALLYNLGRAHQALGELPKALDALERFRKIADPETLARARGVESIIADLRARVAGLSVRCAVAGATVRLRDRTLGTTPLAPGRVVAGHARLEVLADGYEPYAQEVTLTAGKDNVVDVELRPLGERAPAAPTAAANGTIAVASDVAGATVSIDGVGVGVAPIEQNVRPGAHRVRVAKDGFVSVTKTATVEADARATVSVNLSPDRLFYETWWFWTATGAVVVGATVSAAVLARPHTTDPPAPGTLGPGVITGPSAIRF